MAAHRGKKKPHPKRKPTQPTKRPTSDPTPNQPTPPTPLIDVPWIEVPITPGVGKREQGITGHKEQQSKAYFGTDSNYVTRNPLRSANKKRCPFCGADGELKFDNISVLKPFLSSTGSLLPRRLTGLCAIHYREVYMALRRIRALQRRMQV